MASSPIVCVDASFVLRLLLGGPGSGRAENLWEQWGRDEVSAMAPGLIYFEITKALHRLSVNSSLGVEEADQFLGLALELSIDIRLRIVSPSNPKDGAEQHRPSDVAATAKIGNLLTLQRHLLLDLRRNLNILPSNTLT